MHIHTMRLQVLGKEVILADSFEALNVINWMSTVPD